MRTIIKPLLVFVAVTAVPAHAASPIVLEDPLAMYFTGPSRPAPGAVQDLIEQSMKKVSKRGYEWTVRQQQPGLIAARLTVRGRHIMDVDIKYSRSSIRMIYRDSQRMDYDTLDGGVAVIHPNYQRWVDTLAKEIRNAATYSARAELLDAFRNPDVGLDLSQLSAPIIVVAYGEPGRYAAGRRSRSTKIYSDALADGMAGALQKSLPDDAVVLPVHWSRTGKRVVLKDRNNRESDGLCILHNARAIVIGSVIVTSDGVARTAKFARYDCASGDRREVSADLAPSGYDDFGYQVSIMNAFGEFIRQDARLAGGS